MMNYEKKYNEALELAKSYYGQGCNEFLDTIFPELRESEDEKIRRTLVEYFGPEAQLDFIRGVKIQKIQDWLEKQKDHFRDRTKLVLASALSAIHISPGFQALRPCRH